MHCRILIHAVYYSCPRSSSRSDFFVCFYSHHILALLLYIFIPKWENKVLMDSMSSPLLVCTSTYPAVFYDHAFTPELDFFLFILRWFFGAFSYPFIRLSEWRGSHETGEREGCGVQQMSTAGVDMWVDMCQSHWNRFKKERNSTFWCINNNPNLVFQSGLRGKINMRQKVLQDIWKRIKHITQLEYLERVTN